MRARALFASLMALAVPACAMGPVPAPQPTLQNLQVMRAADIPPMAVGRFTSTPATAKRTIVVRAGTMTAPGGGDFAGYLGQTLAAELTAAGKLQPDAPLVVSGVLTRSMVDSDMPIGHAALGATFTVTRDGRVVFEKDLTVQTQWQSEFLGAVAIPQAMNSYTGLYGTLVAALFADPDFRAAVRG